MSIDARATVHGVSPPARRARPPGRLLLGLAALQFGFGFHGVVYAAFGGAFLRARFGLAVPEAAQLLALGLLLFGLLQFAAGLVADLGVRLYGRKAMLVRVAATYTLARLLFAVLPLPLPAVVGAGLGGLAGAGLPIVLSYLSDHTERGRSGLVAGLQEGVLVVGQVATALLVVALFFAGGAALLGDQLWRRRRDRPPGPGRGRPAAALAPALAAVLAACAPPSDRAAGARSVLHVASSVDGTVAQLDAGTGRPLGPPLPAGPLPWQLARGPDGSLLALSASPTAAWPLSASSGRARGGRPGPWRCPGRPARPASPAPAGATPWWSTAGRRPRRRPRRLTPGAGSPGCRLTLVDVPAGTVAAAATAAVSGPRDQLTGLALGDGPGGPVAYLALRRPAAPGDAGAAGDADRIAAVSARTGATLAVFRTGGVPLLVAVGPSPGGLGHRLYAVERPAGPEDAPPSVPSVRLLGLHPTTLALESERSLDLVPTRLVVAADGAAAYALHDHALTRVDLAPDGAGGADRRLARLPAQGQALAVAGDRVYVTSAYGRDLWAFRRRDGRLVATLPVGPVPADLLLGPAE